MIQIHIATALFGLAGLFGKWVGLPAVAIVFGRVVCAALFLFPMIRLAGLSVGILSYRDRLFFALQGVILAFHWVAFFQAIKLSSVAVGLLTFAAFPVFTAFLEPLFDKKPFEVKALIPALITLFGVQLVVPEFELESQMFQGALWGLASGLSFAVLSLLNRRFVARYHGAVVAFWQDAAAAVALFPIILLAPPSPAASDLALLILLGVLFTGVAHTLFIQGMKHVSARKASIVVSLEPVYGIAAATCFLGEIPTAHALAGGVIILSTAFWITAGHK